MVNFSHMRKPHINSGKTPKENEDARRSVRFAKLEQDVLVRMLFDIFGSFGAYCFVFMRILFFNGFVIVSTLLICYKGTMHHRYSLRSATLNCMSQLA